MKKFLKENWQYLIITGILIGAGLALSIAVVGGFLTGLINALLWILEVLITYAA